MKPLIFLLLLTSLQAYPQASATWEKLRNDPSLAPSRADMLAYDHFLRIYKIADKGYASAYILDKGLKDSARHSRWAIFHDWLQDLRRFPSLPMDQLISACLELQGKLHAAKGLPRTLMWQRLSSCRQVVLQQLAPKILADGKITPEEHNFLAKNMRALLYGRNQPDFLWFMQRLPPSAGPHAEISGIVAAHVVRANRQLPKDFLPTMVITPELTQHIQKFGLDEDATTLIFQTEFSRLVEELYASIDKKDSASVTRQAGALGKWLRLNLAKLPREKSLGRFGDLGKNLWRNGYSEAATDVFDLVMHEGSPDVRDDARFYRLWMWLNKGEWKEGRKWVEGLALHKRFHELVDSRLKFWIAALFQQTGSGDEARVMWERTITDHPLGFYAIMAQKNLKAHHPSSKLVNYYLEAAKDTPPTLAITELGGDATESFRRLRAWARLDQKEFLHAELRGLSRDVIPSLAARLPPERQKSGEGDAWVLAASIVGQEGNFLESFRVLYAALDRKKAIFNRSLLESLYPKPYYEQLQKTMKGQEIDPLLVLSLIRQESVFNPQARSRVGARGLMQIMPQTARRLKRGVRDNHLSTPATNLELGTKYFVMLHKRYEGNLVHVLAAYNAGEARVHRWKGTYLASDEMLPSIENIPFLETRNYVKLIFRNLFFYKTLEGADTPDPSAHNRIHDVSLGFKR